jgi:Transglutaminase-like enzymes, putative cysteine proteases
MKIFILTVIFAVSTAQAEWAPNNEADVVLDYSNATFTVKADGSYVMEEERKFTAKNETGRNKLALEKVQFIPEITTVQVMRASSLTEGNETQVNLKTITERAAAGPESGISGAKEIIIPFTNLKIGSSVKYKVLHKVKPAHPGIFSMAFVYGLMFPELAGEVKIRSEKKLLWVSTDKSQFLNVTEGKDGKYFTLNIKMTKPMNKTLKDETLAILNHDTFPTVQVTTLENWNSFAKMLTPKYEAALAQELPPAFSTIVAKASAKTDIYDRIDTVTSELATIMTYSGDWTTTDKMFFPRGHKEVATSKTGDCKDFATSTAGMLRKMGIKATVALVNRKAPFTPTMKIQSTPIKAGFAIPTFNHAIVRVETPDKKIIWVDPTNPVSNSRVPDADIYDSAALNLALTANDVEMIPAPSIDDSVVRVEKRIRVMPDDTAETEGTISMTGVYSTGIKREAFMDSKKKADGTVLKAFGSIAESGVKADYSSRVAGSLEAKVKTYGEKIYAEKDSKNYLLVPVPYQLQLLFAGAGYNRVTDLYVASKNKVTTIAKVEGYDFDQEDSQGCLALSPYVDFERKLFKVEGGFEVRDSAVFKKEMITAAEMNDQEFKAVLGDLRSCVSAQTITVKKIDPNLNLQNRLALYTVDEIQKMRDLPGIEANGKAQKMKLYAEQILLRDPDNMDAYSHLLWANTQLGYRYGDVWGVSYLEAVDKICDDLLKSHVDHPAILLRKTYTAARMNKADDAKKLFNKTYYATKNKDFAFYKLGAVMGRDVFKDPKIEKQSHLKSLEVATKPSDKSDAYKSLARIASKEGNTQQAEEYYQYALQLSPKDAWLMNDILVLATETKNYQKAIDIGEKMVSIADFGMGRRNLASAYGSLATETFKVRSKPNADKARMLAMKGLKWDSNSEECLTAMGYIMSYVAQEMNDPVALERAIATWQKLVQVAENPRTSQFAMMQLGFAYQLKSKVDLSSKNAEKLVMKLPPPPAPLPKDAKGAAATRSPASAVPTTSPATTPVAVPVTATDQ